MHHSAKAYRILQNSVFRIAALSCYLLSIQLIAGDPPEDIQERLYRHIENLLELETEEESAEYADLLENLEWLSKHPINLNRATADELRQLFVLTDIQIRNLLLHIHLHGNLMSIYELQTIEGFEHSHIEAILPFVTIDDTYQRRNFSFDNMLRDGEQVLFVRWQQLFEEQKGFSAIDADKLAENPSARYLGSPYRLYTRYRFTWYRNVSFGFTAEKDPGEEFFRGTQPHGFDFYSAHLHLRDFGRLKTLSVGDFQAQFGQGLCFWSGMGFGKSSEGIGVKKNAPGLRQYTSVDENNFLRGVGATVLLGPLELTAFYSSKRRDANVLMTDSMNDQSIITSLQQTGLHRTPRELEGNNAVRENIFGANLNISKQHFSIGITASHMKLDALFERNLSFYNRFEFSNNRHLSIGIDYSYLTRNLNLFGEAAMDANGRLAFLNGLMISLDSRLSISIVHRHYDKRHQAPFASAFGESNKVANEIGLYAAIEIRPAHRLRLYAYADHFSFPWMRFRTYMPSQGTDYMLHIEYKPTREIEIYARYRSKTKPLNTRDDIMIRVLEDVKRTQYRLHVGYPVSPVISLRNRFEIIQHQYGDNRQKGYMLYCDLLYRSLSSPFAITFRYTLFNTDGFDSRIYAYEHDVLYAFSFPFYSDKGSRIYFLVRYRVHRQVDLYCRIAQTHYLNRNESGSGTDLIEGNQRTEVKAQLRFRF
jgi:hypothetical protein